MYSSRNKTAKVNTTRSTRKHLAGFKRLARADRYATACNAAFRLAGELLKLGQSQATIARDLAALSGLPVLLLAEIVQAARDRAEGGQQ